MSPKRITLFALAAFLTGCDNPQSALWVRGAPAIELRQLMFLFVVICAIVWLCVIVVLIAALLRRRRPLGAGDKDRAQRQRKLRLMVVSATICTALIIAGLTTASFFVTHRIDSLGAPAFTIRIRGEQWWWRITYPNHDQALAFETANEIHIPVGRTIRLELEAADVIHSFWVPSLAGKQDLVPGRSNTLTIRVERAGVYRGQCAEFCGLQHGHMAAFVIAEPPAEFEKWAALQRQPAPAPTVGEASAGRSVFLSKPCAACHTVRGTVAVGKTGPDLTHLGSRKTIAAGLLDTTRGSLAAWIADPQTLKPGNNMPMTPLTSDELQALSAYLESLK
jgi:cytochrome c oxidase subunit 2